MLRSPAMCAFALVAFLFVESAGCSATTGSWREVDSLKEAGAARPLVGPGTLDAANLFLPAVLVITTLFDRTGNIKPMTCSGALVGPRVVLTAGHCVCLFREPTSSDNLATDKSLAPDAGAVVTRARALRGITVTEILDKRSSCGQFPLVATLVYGKPGEEPQRDQYSGTVVVHPAIELIAGASQGPSSVVWNNADLAVILLDRPVPLDFQPLSLPNSEVELGDALIMAGYGPTGSEGPYGTRRFGENRVTKIVRNPTGNVVFGAAASPLPDGGVPARARPGDSGGACVSKENPNVLIGIVTTEERSAAGGEMSNFTSIFPHRGWLLEFIRQAGPAADAGVDVRGSDAGLAPPPPPATR